MSPTTSPETVSRRIAIYVAEGLADAGISTRQAAKRTGIPPTTLHRRLNDRSRFLVSELAKLADLLGTKPSDLVAAVSLENTFRPEAEQAQ